METKKYWQAVDSDGERKTFLDNKPELSGGIYSDEDEWIERFLFDIPLKPLQIAEITVCDDGTWSYEIEREEGWYMAVGIDSGMEYLVLYKNGEYRGYSRGLYGKKGNVVDTRDLTISPTRIPDECII